MANTEREASLEELKHRLKGLRTSLEDLEEIVHRKDPTPSRIRVAARSLHSQANMALETACEFDGIARGEGKGP